LVGARTEFRLGRGCLSLSSAPRRTASLPWLELKRRFEEKVYRPPSGKDDQAPARKPSAQSRSVITFVFSQYHHRNQTIHARKPLSRPRVRASAGLDQTRRVDVRASRASRRTLARAAPVAPARARDEHHDRERSRVIARVVVRAREVRAHGVVPQRRRRLANRRDAREEVFARRRFLWGARRIE